MCHWSGLYVVFLALLVFSRPALAQSPDGDTPQSGISWRNRPSIQLGPHVRLDLRLKLAHDWRRFDTDTDPDTEHTIWRLRRAGVNGELGSHLSFQIERDLHRDGRWRDVYANWQSFRQIEVRAGRFKVPFGYEELTSVTEIDFAARALASSVIPPARDKGVMVHGRFLRRGLTYEFGVFNGDGDAGNLREEQFVVTGPPDTLGPSFALRVTGTPFRPVASIFERLRVGVAVGAVDVPEGLNSLRGSTVFGTSEFFAPVYVKGRRTRMGVELSYMPGPLGLTAEWMQAREQRQNQGLGDVDLSDVLTTGWYAAATWLVTGEDKQGFNGPRRPLFRGGIGAIQVGARYEELRFESADRSGPAFRNPRAEHILPNSDAVSTLGVNWYPNRWVRLVFNAVREEFDDAARTPAPGTSVFWSGVARLQLVF